MKRKMIWVRRLNWKTAETLILHFVKTHRGAYTSAIADALKLDVILVNKLLHKLAGKRLVK